MTAAAIQQSLNARFTYRPDRRESWRILKGDGPFAGDCEDYALTLIWMQEGQSLLRFWWALTTFKYVLWFCRAPTGVGHAVVWCRGRGWTDNIQGRMVPRKKLKRDGYRMRFPYLVPMVALKLAI